MSVRSDLVGNILQRRLRHFILDRLRFRCLLVEIRGLSDMRLGLPWESDLSHRGNTGSGCVIAVSCFGRRMVVADRLRENRRGA